MPDRPKILLVEGDGRLQPAYRRAFSDLAGVCQLAKCIDNVEDALDFISSHHKQLAGVVTDLRIKGGPKQGHYPPWDEGKPLAIRLLELMVQEGITDIPVVGYSRYLAKGSPTYIAARDAKEKHPFLLDVLKTKPNPVAVVRKAVRLILEAPAL